VTIGSFRAIVRLRRFANNTNEPLTIITNLAGIKIPTGVENEEVRGKSEKILHNGQLILIVHDAHYDITGKRL